MQTPSLKEFAQATPVCEQTAALAAVLEIFRSSRCDAIVVVSEQQRPLGVVNLRQVMPYLIPPQGLGESPVTIAMGDFHKPLSQLEPPIIEPLSILSAQLNLSQFWTYLQESVERWEGGKVGKLEKPANLPKSQPTQEQPYWALVDEEGKFLGLLNSWLLLKSLAPTFTARNADAGAGEQPQATDLNALAQLLEQLPLPLSLQTATGQVVAQNLTWREQIGMSPDLGWVRRTTAAMLDSPSVEPHSALASSAVANALAPKRRSVLTPPNACGLKEPLKKRPALTPDGMRRERSSAGLRPATPSSLDATASRFANKAELTAPNVATDGLTRSLTRAPFAVTDVASNPYECSARTANQRYCAIATPRMAAAVSKSQVKLSSPSAIKTHEAPAFCKASAPSESETHSQSQERVFSFVKVPLSPLVVTQEKHWGIGQQGSSKAGEWENFTRGLRPTALTPLNPLCSNSLTSDLWLVLAQDTTEQQQVAKELAAKNADLVQLNRLKDEFLACISHELKTPLTAVLGLSSLLKDQTLGELNERQARYARLIYQSGRQLMTVVNDILDLTRMETGQLELMLEPVPIKTVCDRAYSQARQRPQEKDQEEESTPEIQYTLEIEPGLETLVADELRLCQMLVHLLSNAIKFTEVGGEIGLRVNCWEGWIAFTVWDTGIGIPPEKQHLIFQKFQQLEQPLTRRFEGTGLGLVLTQRLAHLHGGDISFISKTAEGSEFTLLLPPCPPQARGKVEEIPESQIPNSLSREHSGKRNRLVLIVETVPRYLEGLTEQLKHLGYLVVIARSGTEAIEKARSLQPCAILLNPLLPQLSGWDVLTLLKSDAHTLHIPVFVTATQADKQQAYHNKADGFLSLPVQEKALRESLNNLGESQSPTKSGLTILHLKPEEVQAHPDSCVGSFELTQALSLQHSELNYRILEADDLEQAELLARVWHPDIILLDGAGIADPLAYLKQFSLNPDLTHLPLVTLDHQTTEAANQVTGLSVYPCLESDNSSKIPALLQVIQVAAGMLRKPSILVIDIGEQENSCAGEICQSKTQPSRNGKREPKSKITSPLTPQYCWLQALVQYLQTAGFTSLLSSSWTEVYRQLQDQSVDLLLIRLKDISDSSAVVNKLVVLAQLQKLPPIFVLDHRLDVDSAATPRALAQDEAVTGNFDSTCEVDSLLGGIATQILRGTSQSMSQLLDLINQTLSQK